MFNLRKSHTQSTDDTLPKVSFKCLSIPFTTRQRCVCQKLSFLMLIQSESVPIICFYFQRKNEAPPAGNKCEFIRPSITNGNGIPGVRLALLMAVQFLLPTLTCYEKSGNFPRKTSVQNGTDFFT